MRATCKYSGIEFQTQHFPYTFRNSIQHHPVFDIPFPDLLAASNDWLSDHYTPIDKRLLFLALIKSTELVQFRTYARPSDNIISCNMDTLIEWAAYIHGIKTKQQFECLPRYVITQESSHLSNIDGWFSTWQDAITEYKDQYRTYNAAQMQVRREDALSRIIKDPNRITDRYIKQLAEWAGIAAAFPDSLVTTPEGSAIPLRDYWCDLIRKCGNKQFQIWRLNRNDLSELEEHLEYNLPHGTIVSHELMVIIRHAIKRHDSAFGISSIDSPAFVILDPKDNVEKANILAAASLAPAVEPTAQDYPDKVSFLRAKARWNLAQAVRAAEQKASLSNAGIDKPLEDRI